MLSAVLLHMVKSALPVHFQTSLNAFFNGCSGMVNMAGANSLNILDLDRLVQCAIITGLSAAFREEDYG